jgi:glutamyl-Q tRNA(Asp) synthetase
LPTGSGDFILKRRDELWAYQLAVVVDDAAQGITDIVRGEDLLSSTARQIALQKALAYPTPSYLHLPLVVDATGQKWAKQTGAPALNNAQARSNLHRALTLLGLQSDPQAPCHRQLDDGCRQWPSITLQKGALTLEESLD